MAAPTNYPYRALKETEIRLLKILPKPGLQFEVIHHDLSKSLDYATLSYTWGDPIFCKLIHLYDTGEYWIQVTDNLHEALQNLKIRHAQKDPHTKFKYIWIDQICINQNDPEEKGVQVQMMKRIYQQSCKIIVWLGNPENQVNTALAVQKMKEFTAKWIQILRKNLIHLAFPAFHPFKTSNDAFVREHRYELGKDHFLLCMSNFSVEDIAVFDVEGTPTYNAWLGICDLFKKPWWNRTWIYQESTTPSRFILNEHKNYEVAFLCGLSSINWRGLTVTMHIAKKIWDAQLPHASFLGQCWVGCERLEEFKEFRRQIPTAPLLELLQKFRYTKCHNPRDKIIAPRGLAAKEVIEKVKCEYSQSVLEAYLGIARFCLSDEPKHELDFLGYTMKSNQAVPNPTPRAEDSSLPSWLPNWDQPLQLHPIPKVLYKQVLHKSRTLGLSLVNPLPTKEGKAQCYNASSGTGTQTFISGDRLIVKGVRCDIIKDIIEFRGLDASEAFQEKTTSWEAAAKGKYVTGEPWFNALRRTQAMDIKYNWQGQVYERNFLYQPGLCATSINPKKLLETMAEEETRVVITFIEKRHFSMRSLCVTEKGYLGMVPETTKVGDIVCVLLGGQVLYTLRYPGAGDKYEYIGEAYLHGLMDGEVMEWVADPKVPTWVETFVLV